MSISKKLMTTGATDIAYVDDVFSTYLYEGNGGTQVINNGIALGDGLRGGLATYFDGTSNIKLNDGVEIVSSSTAYTVSFWIRTEDSEPQRPVALAHNTYYQMEKNRLRFYAIGTNGSPVGDIMYTCSDITDGLWHHVVHSVTTNSSVMYFDGVLAPLYAGSMNGSGSMKGLSSGLALGGQTTEDAYSSDFTGSLAYVYMDTNYRDLSNESTLRLFINADGSPTSSATLEGLAPQVFFPLADLYNAGSVPDSDFTTTGWPQPVEGCDEFSTGEGGMVWIKCRNFALNNMLYDTERGVGKALISDISSAEGSENLDQLNSFNSDGFSTGSDVNTNVADRPYASWTFRKAKNFFDVVTYTGDGVAGREIPHNLGVEPGMVIVKSITQGENWEVFHRGLGATKFLILNDTDAAGTYPMWYDVAPTSAVFTVSAENAVNKSGGSFVAYVFAHDDSDESLIKCGSVSYDGTNPVDVDLGFEPQFILRKSATVVDQWYMTDCLRGLSGTVNGPSALLYPNLSDAEYEASYQVSVNSNGFTIGSGSSSAQEYIYMAIRRPNKPAEEFEPEELFSVEQSKTDGVMPGFRPGFPVDMSFYRTPTSANETSIQSRLTQGAFLETQSTNAEASKAQLMFDYMDGWYADQNAALYSWMWRRAPGFFDVVAYSGTGTERGVPHNLGVTPEMLIIKARDLAGKEWFVHHTGLTSWAKVLQLQSTAAETIGDTGGNLPTATTFPVNTGSNVNGSGYNYIAYLWASVPGISSIGSYTGNGGSQDIDCGFTNGARFVLIKCTSSGELSSNWYVWDSVRGIGSGNDPYICLNNTATQEVFFDALDTLPAGFTIKQEGPNVNQTGEDYIYMAIA